MTGTGGRRDRLRLAAEVGAALVDYLRQGRPRVAGSRVVFVRQFAPIRGLAGTGAIRGVLARACHRAGIPYLNPHRLPHTLASEMLAAGVSLDDIGQLLGHRGSVLTASYAKVDLDALRGVAGGGRISQLSVALEDYLASSPLAGVQARTGWAPAGQLRRLRQGGRR